MPSVSPPALRIYRFGVFELDVYARELRKSGSKLNVQDQPLLLLELLLERPGELVTRDELRQQLWPSDTFVGFEHGLNAAVRRLRETLGDSAETPRFIETLPRRGYRFIGPVATAGAAASSPSASAAQTSRAWSRTDWWRSTAVSVVLLSGVTAGLVGLAVWLAPPPPHGAVVRTQLDVQPAHDVYSIGLWDQSVWTGGGSRTAVAWSPGGRSLVFVGRRTGVPQLYARDLAHAEARLLTGTEGAQLPVVSADGQWVVFWAKGEIRRVPLEGGPVQTVVAGVDDPPFGMTVGITGRVAFGRELDGIWQAVSGSAPTPATTLAKGELQHALPQLLANDTVLLFTVRSSFWTWGAERVMAQVLATGERKLLVNDAADARYVPSGHLVFLRRGLLMAAPFDLADLEVTGPAVGPLDKVAQALTSENTGDMTGAGQFSVSAAGDLAYISSPVTAYPDATLVSVSRRGRVSALPGETRTYMLGAKVSPDGRQVAVSIRTVTEVAVWILDLIRGSLTKLTTGGEAMAGSWTPDGQHIAFWWLRDGLGHVAWQRADGTGAPETLASGALIPVSWSPDGHRLALLKDGDIWEVTVGRAQPAAARVTHTPEEERSPEFSPDGRWLAYASNKTGRFEVYLRSAGASTPVTLASLAGGASPVWNPRGRELYFVAPRESGGQRLMAVAVADDGILPPVPLFDLPPDLLFDCMPSRCYDVTRDGQRFIATRTLPRDPPPPVAHINMVLNWVEELRSKVPAPQ